MSTKDLTNVWEEAVEDLSKDQEASESQTVEETAKDAENLFEAARW